MRKTEAIIFTLKMFQTSECYLPRSMIQVTGHFATRNKSRQIMGIRSAVLDSAPSLLPPGSLFSGEIEPVITMQLQYAGTLFSSIAQGAFRVNATTKRHQGLQKLYIKH